MKSLPKAHLWLFVLAWVVGFTWGPAGIIGATTVVLLVELAMWRADLVRFDTTRRSWRIALHPERPAPVPSYDAVKHAIAMGAHSRREFDFNMRRRLERIAGVRLDAEHGVDLHRDPPAARALLGDEAWELVDPSRPVSGDRTRGGVPTHTLARIIDRLEGL